MILLYISPLIFISYTFVNKSAIFQLFSLHFGILIKSIFRLTHYFLTILPSVLCYTQSIFRGLIRLYGFASARFHEPFGGNFWLSSPFWGIFYFTFGGIYFIAHSLQAIDLGLDNKIHIYIVLFIY